MRAAASKLSAGNEKTMSDLFVMRRANGELLTEEIGGRLYIPVWRSQDGVARYQARNPELIIFFPAKLDRSIKARLKAGTGRHGAPEFLLLSDDDPAASLEAGEPMPLEKLLPEADAEPRHARV
jgi:hypothetical protein